MFKILIFAIILITLVSITKSVIGDIVSPIILKAKSKQKLRIAEAELEASKNEAIITDLEIKKQDIIYKSIENLCKENKKL
jgi:hypothetical protein